MIYFQTRTGSSGPVADCQTVVWEVGIRIEDGTSSSFTNTQHWKVEYLETWVVGPVSAYNVTG